MKVSVIIVTWNSRAHIGACLESIRAHTSGIDYEVIVVDNASSDGTANAVEQSYDWVRLVRNDENVGFGRANNAGVQVATGDILFFLNDDTQLMQNSIQIMAEKMNPNTGVLGCHLTFADGSHQDSVRRDPHVRDQLVILTKMHNFFPALIQRYLAQDMDYEKEQEVEQLMGACMMMHRQTFEEVGGFDKRFFIWFEEVDLIKRIREKGRCIVYTPVTQIVHLKGESFGKVRSVKKQRMFQRSLLQYFVKHQGVMRTLPLMAVTPLGLLLSGVVELVSRLGGNIKKLKHGQS